MPVAVAGFHRPSTAAKKPRSNVRHCPASDFQSQHQQANSNTDWRDLIF